MKVEEISREIGDNEIENGKEDQRIGPGGWVSD